MQGKCIYQFNPEVKARATAWQLRRLQIHGGANCTIYQFYQEGKQEKPAGNVIDLDFRMQSVFHLHLLLFLRNSLCFRLSKADRFIWLFYFNFCLFLQVFSQSSFLFFISVAELNKFVQWTTRAADFWGQMLEKEKKKKGCRDHDAAVYVA